MKKKVLSIFLALMLCLSLLPTAALAEEAGTAGAGDTLAAEQGEGNTVAGQGEDSTGTGQDEDSTGTGQGEGNVLSEQSVSAAAFSSAAETHSHAVGGENVTFTAWTKTDSLPDATGNYYLTDSVTLTETWTPADGVILDLNGKSIEFKDEHTSITVHYSFTLTDCKGTGTITHGEKDDGSKYPGSGVSVAFGTFHMEGGSITGNSATNGGGVYVFYGTFNMSGGSITGNTATGDGNTPSTGGGVFVSEDSTFSMSGGSITDNTAANGGGVYVHDTFTVSGGVKISGNNKSDGSNSNVYLSNGKTISVTGALDGAEIGVTTKETPAAGSSITIAEGGGDHTVTTDDAKVFFADDLGKYKTEFAEGVVRLREGETLVEHPVCGKVCTHMDSEGNPKHSDVRWKPWSKTDKLPSEGYYYLTANVTLASTQTFVTNTTVALDLNGKTVSTNASSHTILSLGNVTLTDCKGTGTLTHSAGSGGRGVRVEGGTFDMYSGSITGNKIDRGGGVFVNGGTFNLYGGSISGNRAGTYGGGVYVEHGKFNMEGGRIDNNYSEIYGGGVGMGGGTFHMKGGDISNNNAPHNGGVFVNGGEFNMSDGSISRNEATSGGNSRGGGVRVDKGTFHMSGGSITDNKATGSNDGHGGGVYAGQNGTFTMSGTASITDNHARCGGGVYVVGTFNMSDGSITGNKVTGSGGGVYIHEYEKGTFTVSGAVRISGNTWWYGSADNVRLSDGKAISVTSALGGAKIGVTTEKTPKSNAPITIANGDNYTLIETDRDCFTPDKGSEYQVNLSNNTLVLAVPPHVHSWTYTASGDTITATCTAKGCTLDNRIGGSYTIVKPPHEVYGDGKDVEATITVAAAEGVTLPDAGSITYAKGGTALDAAPVDAGEYTASITLGSATAKVTFKIAKADAPDAPSGLTGYVGKALSTVALPSGWTWVDGDAVMNTAGDAVEFMANYGGDNNHEPASNVAVSVKVVETSGGDSTGGNTGGGTGGGGTGGNTGGGSGHRVSTSAPAAPAKLPTLLLGSRSSDVKTLQEMLNAKGYNAGSVDGIFGRNTRAAVIAFQNANGLAADGIVGKLTWAKLYDTTTALPSASTATGTQPMVYRGSRGDAVRRLQELLHKKGFDCGAVDGIFGSKTYAAVMAFQKANGLSADGIAGPLTWGKLG